jgi:hypothetical protein
LQRLDAGAVVGLSVRQHLLPNDLLAHNQGCHALLQAGQSLCFVSAEEQRLIRTQIDRLGIEAVLDLRVIRVENQRGMGR